MKSPITSRELLTDVGAPIEDEPEIPPRYQQLLITSVIMFVSAKKFQKALNSRGDNVSLRDITEWQRATRKWLGLPEVGRGKPSDEYRNEVKKWLQSHGNPTLDDIDSGWVPIGRQGKCPAIGANLSPRSQKIIEEFRMQMANLAQAKDDSEVNRLLTLYLGKQGDQK